MAEDPQTQEDHMVRAEGGPREEQTMRKKWQVEVMEGHLSLATWGRKRSEAKVWSVLAFSVTLNHLGRKE